MDNLTDKEKFENLEVGDLFIDNGEIKRKLKGIPPVIPVVVESVRKANPEDYETLPEIDFQKI